MIPSQFKLSEKIFCCYTNCNKKIATKPFTWRNRCIVMACAEIRSELNYDNANFPLHFNCDMNLVGEMAHRFDVSYDQQMDVWFNTLRPRQNGHRFTDDIFKCIFLNENICSSLKISLKFVPKVPVNNIPAMVQITAWRRPGDKPLSEPMVVSLPTHICVVRREDNIYQNCHLSKNNDMRIF